MSVWQKKAIKQLGRVVTGKTPPTDVEEYWNGDELFVSPKDMTRDSTFIQQTQAKISRKALNKFKGQILPKNSVMYTALSYGFGKIGIAKQELITNQQINSIIVNEDHDFRFVYYLMRVSTPYIFSFNSGIDTPIVPKSVFEKIELLVPSFNIQRKIAAVLSAYDDLIENNNRRIAILEKMAEELYREWFVRLRFPGHKKTKISKGIPEGWEIKRVSDIVLPEGIETGKRPKGGAQTNGIPSVGAENVIGIARYDFSKEKFVFEDFFNKMQQGKILDRDILFYKDGAEIGRVSLFQDNFPHSKCCVNEHVFLIRATNKDFQYYLYFSFARKAMFDYIQALNKNAAQPGINKAELNSIPLVWPKEDLIIRFNQIIEPMIKQLFGYAKEQSIIKRLRDNLLSRLMSGKIDLENLDIQFPAGMQEKK